MLRSLIAAVALLGMLAGSAQAAPDITSSLALNEMDPHLGGTVTFTATYPQHYEHLDPRVAIRCYQNGVMVYAEAGPWEQAFVLGGASSGWLRAGGPASCTAELFAITWPGHPCKNMPKLQVVETLAWTEFEADGSG